MTVHVQGHGDRTQELLEREPDKWVHHVVDLDKGGPVSSVELDRPIGWKYRRERILALTQLHPATVAFIFQPERRLSPRNPYQGLLPSYLQAVGDGWNLETDKDWLYCWPPASPSSHIDFSFLSVFPLGAIAIVSIKFQATNFSRETKHVHVEPIVPQGSSQTVDVAISGTGDYTADLIVKATDPSHAVVISLRLTSDVEPPPASFTFREITFSIP